MRAGLEPSTYLTLADLRARYGVSRMWIYRRVRKAGFPHGRHLGGGKLLFWPRAEIEQWEANNDNHKSPPTNVGPTVSGSAGKVEPPMANGEQSNV